jgi:hypothetical protein
MLAGSNLATAATNPNVHEVQVGVVTVVTLEADFLREFRLPQQDNSSHLDQGGDPQLTELAQIYGPVATTCYTFAGPTCPMVVALPPGSSCACYYNGSTLAGIAY